MPLQRLQLIRLWHPATKSKVKERTMKKFYLIFAAMTIATGCCKDVTVFVLDQEAEFYNPNQKTVNLKKHPICNSPMMAAQMAETVFVNVYGEKVLKERPWHVTDMGDSYAVTGSLEKGFLGGVAQLKIKKEKGAVVLHLHGK
jgi:hypothetical protein